MFEIYNNRKQFYQWDTGQRLIVNDYDCTDVHFGIGDTDNSLRLEIYEVEGKRVVDVPDILLQEQGILKVYAFVRDGSDRYTKRERAFRVFGRPKPEGYVYTEAETLTYASLSDRIRELEEISGQIVSPVIEIDDIEGGSRLTITDADGIKSIDVMNGIDGDSPSITVTNTDDGHSVSITDKNGTQTFDIHDGVDGNPLEIDDTLTEAGKAADAKVVGDAIEEIKSRNTSCKLRYLITETNGVWSMSPEDAEQMYIASQDSSNMLTVGMYIDGNYYELPFVTRGGFGGRILAFEGAYKLVGINTFTGEAIVDSVVVPAISTDISDDAESDDKAVSPRAVVEYVDEAVEDLSVADENTLGGVMPVAKTGDMLRRVGIDSDGRLFTSDGIYIGEDEPEDASIWVYSDDEVEEPLATEDYVRVTIESAIPNVDEADNGKVMTVVDGRWEALEQDDVEDGISPVVEVASIDGGNRLIVTDADGVKTVDIMNGVDGTDGRDGRDGVDGQNGRDGVDGYTPVKGVDYFDGQDGADGKDGENGTDGEDGFSPVVAVSGISGGKRITITDKAGVHNVDVMDGVDGEDGHTPVKGVDYFDGKSAYQIAVDAGYMGTEADFASLLARDVYSKAEVDSALGAYIADIAELVGGDA